MLPLAADCPIHQRAQHTVAGVHAGQMIGERDAHALRLARIGQQAQQTAARLADGIVARHVAVRPLGTEAGNRTVNDLGIELFDSLVTEAALVQDAGTKVLNKHIGAG